MVSNHALTWLEELESVLMEIYMVPLPVQVIVPKAETLSKKRQRILRVWMRSRD